MASHDIVILGVQEALVVVVAEITSRTYWESFARWPPCRRIAEQGCAESGWHSGSRATFECGERRPDAVASVALTALVGAQVPRLAPRRHRGIPHRQGLMAQWQ